MSFYKWQLEFDVNSHIGNGKSFEIHSLDFDMENFEFH